MQSVPITTEVVSSNPGEVYSIQNYMIKFISDLGQVSGFPLVLQFPPQIKLTEMIYLKYCSLYCGKSGFEPWSGQTKDYENGICFFSGKHAVLRSKRKDWLAWNQDNVSEWSDMSIRGLLSQ